MRRPTIGAPNCYFRAGVHEHDDNWSNVGRKSEAPSGKLITPDGAVAYQA